MLGIRPRAAMGVLVVCLGGTIAGCGGTSEPVAETPTATPTTPEAPYTMSGHNGQIRVVERGLSMIEKEGDFPRLSYGVILENLNTRAVAFPLLTLDFIDAQGRSVTEGVDRTLTDVRILPGSRYGVGGTIPFVRPGKVVDIEVEISESVWTTERSQGRFTALRASDVRTQRDFPSEPQATLRFTVESGFTKPLPSMKVWGIFRDASGRIIGGVDDLGQLESFRDVPPGRAPFQLIAEDGLPAGTVDERTEIYVNPAVYPF
ncbi:hypothetical protein [Actinomadura madurae]|uniref:hypothetical protein n=1 Tax=Actinomadura madurae TaxID=1993 RepID=UPI000D884EBD|nr:hypothetical protein [Actinomadura madurae]SPT59983.1 Uncharacterised protein [Actinomadura madurae]